MFKLLICCLLVGLAWSEMSCPVDPKGHHKPKPSPESSLKGCKQYSCNSCCTTNDTASLALKPLQTVNRWNFTQCGRELTSACSDTFQEILCFFKCSPNIYLFFNQTAGRRSIPICNWFCDRWYTTCMNDMTCVQNQNWIKGFHSDIKHDAVDTCKSSSSCRNYTQVYGSGQRMCDSLFGDFFKYSDDEDNCLDPFTESHNVEVINRIYPQAETSVCKVEEYTNYTDAGKIVGIVFGILGGIILILIGLGLFLRRKNSGSENVKPKEKGTVQEMATMNAPTKAPTTANLPKDDSSSEE